jgi:hypothetical protein
MTIKSSWQCYCRSVVTVILLLLLQGTDLVEVEAYITGCARFITLNGSFKTIARSENPIFFKTIAMQRAIEYKWETYGLKMHILNTTILCIMLFFFGSSIVLKVMHAAI